VIFTSTFSKHGHLENTMSIAIWHPVWFNSNRIYKLLIPPADLVAKYKKGWINKNYYTLVYNDQLKELDVVRVASDLQGKILLCYEKVPLFCHRHLVSDWLNQNGFECEEVSEND